jgi:hypothetical protein
VEDTVMPVVIVVFLEKGHAHQGRHGTHKHVLAYDVVNGCLVFFLS